MSAIKPGDLVVIVRPSPCCLDSSQVGKIFRVATVHQNPAHGREARCLGCGKSLAGEWMANGEHHKKGRGIRVSRLKRIPPIESMDDVEVYVELRAR